MSAGILVSQTLRSMVTSGEIRLGRPLVEGQIQPSSLDLRVGARLWQLQCSFLPGPEGIESKLNRLATAEYRFDHDEPVVLHQGGVYLAELEEGLALPDGVWGRGNPKSSTGRLDVFVRLLTRHGEAFDTGPRLPVPVPGDHTPEPREDSPGYPWLVTFSPGASRPPPRLQRWRQSQPV